MSAESCEAEKILVLFCTKKTSREGKKHCKRSFKTWQGWGSCQLNLNVALVLYHREVNNRVSPCVLTGLLSSFDTYSQMPWTAPWKFPFLSTDYRESLNSSSADNYTAALILAKGAFNIRSKIAEQVAYRDGDRI